MAGFRIPGPLQEIKQIPSDATFRCFAGFTPGPLGVNIDLVLHHRVRQTDAAYVSAFPIPDPQFSELDTSIVNASAFTLKSKRSAENGAKLRAIRLIPAGTVLYRIGSTGKFGKPLPVDANFASPWWMRKAEFDRILAKGLQDTAWTARVLLAIADAWGTNCDLQVSVKLTVALYAWIGEGKTINSEGTAVEDSDPNAHWFPEKDLLQLYVPGLGQPFHAGARLFKYALTERVLNPWLPIGIQNNLVTGKPFISAKNSQAALLPGRR